MKSVTVVSQDRDGLLADISYILGKSNINIESLSVDIIGQKAIIALTVKDYKKASNVLNSNGFETAQNDPIVIKLPNRPEELSKIANRLALEKINIENLLVLGNDVHTGVFAINVDKPRKAVKLLNDVLINPGYALIPDLSY